MRPYRLLLVFGLFLGLLGCNLVTGPDLKAKAEKDVQLARALSMSVTIVPNAAGTTSPSGSFDVKEGIAFVVDGSAQPEYVLIGWKQTSGEGKTEFTPVEGSTSKVSVVVTGGNATIEPVYELRPVLLYMTPIGNNIAKNSSVRLVFNREVDLGSDSTPLVTIKKQGVTEVPYTLVTKDGSTTVTLKPTATSLDDYAQYVVTVQAGIPVKALFDPDHYPGVTMVNTNVVSRSEEISPFQTGANFDTLPPYNGSFELVSTTGNAVYTASSSVLLKHIHALDDSGDGGVAAFSVRNGTEAFPDFPHDFRDDSDLPWTLADTIDGQYTVGMIFKDVNGNAIPATSAVENTIALDATPPVVGNFELASSSLAPGFVSTTNVSFSLSALDPTIGGSSFLGSGESIDGSTATEQKQYRVSNDNATWTNWQAFSSSGTVDLGVPRDGVRTAYVQVKDGVGNTSSSTSAALILDQTGPAFSAILADATLITKTTAITLDLRATDSGSGVDKLNLGTGTAGVVTGAGAATVIYPDDGGTHATKTLAPDATMATPITVPDRIGLTLTAGDGKKTVQFVLTDKLGNSSVTNVDLVLDTTAPTVGTNSFTASTTGTATATVTLGASDAGSGLAQVGWIADESATTPSIAGATWQAYQPSLTVALNPSASLNYQYLHLWFKDVAGNVSAPALTTAPIRYDSSSPTVSISLPSSYVNASSSLVSVTWTAQAAAGNITDISLSNDGTTWSAQSITENTTVNGPTTWNVALGGGGSTTNGSRKVWIRATDTAGHTTTKSAIYTYDNVAPTLSKPTLTGTGGSTYTNSTTVSVAFTLADNLSAVGSIRYEITDDPTFTRKTEVTASTSSIATNYVFFTATNEDKIIYVRATDLAGNVCTAQQSLAIKLDTVAPTWSSTPSLDAGALYTTTGVVNLSGIAASDSSPSAGWQMRISNVTNGTWTSWMTYSTTYNGWNLTSSSYGGSALVGAKYAYIQVRDAAGNISGNTVDGITFDNVAPTAAAPTAASTTVSTRVVTVTNNSVTDVGGSSVVSMRYSVGSVVTNWIPIAGTITVLLPPSNGSKTVSVTYKDGAGNVSAAYTITFDLNEVWANLTGRDEMVWGDYNAPTANPVYPTPGVSQENTSWMSGSGMFVLGASNSGNNRCYIFKTGAGQIGKFKYSLPAANQIVLYYVTFNSSNVITQTASPYYSQVALPNAMAFGNGVKCWVDLDAQSGNISATQVAGSDVYLYNANGTIQVYLIAPTLLGLF